MAIDPSIRDQAYQFFIEEAPELLQVLEAELLSLSHDRSTAKIHTLMRAAHSIKGGASSVGLDAIAVLAHRLESIFRALYSDTIIINIELEDQLLRAYDCLRLPLTEQITTGSFDAEQALAIANPILTPIEERCGDSLTEDSYIPSSSDLGVDMVTSIFEVDVVQGLERLMAVLAEPQNYEVAGELQTQVEVFAGFAELLNIPGFGAIAETVQQALNAHPDRTLEIAQLALVEFEQCRQVVLAGDRTGTINISAELIALAEFSSDDSNLTTISAIDVITATEPSIERLDAAVPFLESIFGDGLSPFESTIDDHSMIADANDLEIVDQDRNEDADLSLASTANLEETRIASEVEVWVVDNSESINLESITDLVAVTEEITEGIIDEFFLEQETENTALVKVDHLIPSQLSTGGALQVRQSNELSYSPQSRLNQKRHQAIPDAQSTPNLTIRVDSERLERMNNLVGELMISRDGLSLQSEQLQGVLRELSNRFDRFQKMLNQIRDVTDQMFTSSEYSRYDMGTASGHHNHSSGKIRDSVQAPISTIVSSAIIEFDSLEMDNHTALHSQVQEILEDLVQLEESVEDVTLFTRQSNEIIEQQQQTLTYLQNELKWARMLPLSEVLNRFPRVLRNLSNTYHKPVNLNLVGTETLVDKAILERLYDPLLHLLRNAFDHGIEPPFIRQQQGKPEQGQIEIRAYHKGNQTIIEIKDDGQGLNLDRIRSQAFELGWLPADQLLIASPEQLFELIFEPGFSTAKQVSELSGRGVGLDVVRSQLAAVKGTVTVTSAPSKGTTFTLNLPLTLTVARLVIGLIDATPFALPAESIEEMLTPQIDQTKQSGNHRFLYWREQIIPVYRLADLLHYTAPLPETLPSKALATVDTPPDWAPPLLIVRQEQEFFALEVDRLVNEQELVIKPFGFAIAPPIYAYGCTILGDGSLVPVIDATILLSFSQNHRQPITSVTINPVGRQPITPVKTIQTPTILVVDDAVTLRRTLALSLEREGFRALQARDGWEAIEQLRQNPAVKLVICDVEMPKMNGFELLNYRRQDAQLSQVPIVMLTSRSNEKHRWLAKQLGATDYFTKPYLEHEFLAAIKAIVQRGVGGMG
ncbi:MAG: hybrid sensor histidine kinase/response regulator [Cyanobacteria bacterium RU_5_0]|nr:hybrid sensor histidine kinase/response regulator [Cyanobacteria bacterium RU_5_0]